MTKRSSNILQRIARKAVREIIKEVNTQKKLESAKRANVKSEIRSLKSKTNKQRRNKSRYISASVRVSILNRDNYKCVFCGRSSKQVCLEVDHIIPFSKGGSSEIDNLQTLCFDCNRGKGSRQLN